MGTGAWPKAFGKVIVPLVSEPTMDMCEINPVKILSQNICLWKPAAESVEKPEGVLKDVKELQAAAISNIGETHKALADAMAGHPRWGGAMTKLDTTLKTVEQWDFDGEAALYLDKMGASPWVTCVRAFNYRNGPQAWPLPGFGCLATLAPDNAFNMTMAVLPLGEVLGQGITMQAMPKFFETDAGATVLQEKCAVLTLDRGHVLWVPYGYVAWPLVHYDLDSKHPEQVEKVTPLPLGSLWCYTPFVEKWAQEVSGSNWTAISAYNLEHLEKQKGAMWQERLKIVEDFLGKCKTT